MAYESTIEDIINDIKTFVSTNLGTYLTGISTTKGDGITLAAFKEYSIEDADPFVRGKYPSMLIFPTDINVEQIANGKDEINIELIFLMSFTEGNSATLLTKALRYGEALRQLFYANTNCDEAVDEIDTKMNIKYPPSPDGMSDKKIVFLTARFKKIVGRT